jgi:hypothetical protein
MDGRPGPLGAAPVAPACLGAVLVLRLAIALQRPAGPTNRPKASSCHWSSLAVEVRQGAPMCTVSAGHVEKPDLLCIRLVERMDRLRGWLQQDLTTLFREISFSFRR